jgi:hypothetical protein
LRSQIAESRRNVLTPAPCDERPSASLDPSRGAGDLLRGGTENENVDDFRVKVGFFSHFKTRRLIREAGHEAVIGFMRLWEYCASAAGPKDGDLSGLDDLDIEAIADWSGDRGKFVAALRSCHYLDGHQIHEWGEHQPWVATFGKRSETARENANQRWGSHAPRIGARHTNRMRAACAPHARSNAPSPSPSPLPDLDPVTRKEKKAEGGEVSRPTHAPPAPAVFSIPLMRGRTFDVTQAMVDGWSKAYPDVNVMLDLERAKQHLLANHPKSDGQRFLNNWLKRTQDKGGNKTPRLAFANRETPDQERARKHNEWCEKQLAEQEAAHGF